MRIISALLLLLLAAPHAAPAAPKPPPAIRVAIARNSLALKLNTTSRVYVQEVKGGQKYLLLENSTYEVKPAGAGIAVAGQVLSSPIKLLAAESGEQIRLGKNLYRGDIVIKATAGKLDIIEHLSIEDYLCGVLPSEMSPDWPLEALKAQAVASRTYAMRFINPTRDYDITNGVEMQVYNGTSKISPRIIEAVNSTRGRVLKYRGKLITAFFHAACGGHTASSKAAWGEAVLKPLYGVKDPFCAPSRHSRWEYFLPAADLLKFIQSQGSTALKVKGLKINQKDRSGRVISFRVATESGSKVVKANDMRKRFGNSEFRSTLITAIRPVKGGFELAGRGWGHGVGMCQEGTRYMALKGRPYKRILAHYYPGAAITDHE
jgi:stage II sporulation protein D